MFHRVMAPERAKLYILRLVSKIEVFLLFYLNQTCLGLASVVELGFFQRLPESHHELQSYVPLKGLN